MRELILCIDTGNGWKPLAVIPEQTEREVWEMERLQSRKSKIFHEQDIIESIGGKI